MKRSHGTGPGGVQAAARKQAGRSPTADQGKAWKKQNLSKGGGSADLVAGVHGILITCDIHTEKKAIRECLTLLERLIDEDQLPVSGQSAAAPSLPAPSVSIDLAAAKPSRSSLGSALASELAELREMSKPSKGRPQRALSVLQTGCAGNVFIKLETSLDPTHLVDRVIHQAAESGFSQAPHVVRMLPIHATCPAHREHIMQAAAPLLEELRGTKVSYAIEWRRRCNTGIDKKEVIDGVAAAVGLLAPEARVDLGQPDAVVLVDVMKSICSLSVLMRWQQMHHYNLRAASEKKAHCSAVTNLPEDPIEAPADA
mmetsp:Transcript_34849/g.73306  ORF Transcript_34849/g.73306 Transcript_34849/m.73306 type:complete len:313 (-) Transcript_34849:400-1338(-)